MHAIICIFDFMNSMLFILKFINIKPIIKFKKFELHDYAAAGSGGGRGTRRSEDGRASDRTTSASCKPMYKIVISVAKIVS